MKKAALSLEKTENELVLQQQTIASAEKALERERARQPEAERFGAQASALEARLPEYDAREALRTKEKRARLQRQAEAQSREAGARTLETKTAALAALREERRTLETAGEERQRLLREQQDAETKRKELCAILNLFETLDELSKRLCGARRDYLLKRDGLTRARQTYDRMYRAYLDEQAGVLAQTLVDGLPCPVCGATVHPVPARLSPHAPSKAQLDRARKAAETAASEAEEASRAAEVLRGQLEATRENLARQAPSAERTGIQERIDALEERKTALEAQRREADRRIRRREALDTQIPALDGECRKLDAAIRRSDEQIAALDAGLAEMGRQLAAFGERLRFADKSAAIAERDRLKREQTRLQTALRLAEDMHAETLRTLARLKGGIEQLRGQLSGAEIPNIEALTEQQNEINGEKTALSRRHTALHTRLSANRTALEAVRSNGAALEALERRYAWVRNLADTARGQLSGKERFALETYVQTTYFERIIARANLRFLVMSGGQYELKRRTRGGGSAQSGLELDVVDHLNGSERSVKSLSGGESFLASLSLALGLSDEVQSSAGGIRLDTMFVDEGFGSLDDDTLQQAMRALLTLSENRRLVGVISHVAQLKERIDRQIVVTKDRDGGSHVQINV